MNEKIQVLKYRISLLKFFLGIIHLPRQYMFYKGTSKSFDGLSVWVSHQLIFAVHKLNFKVLICYLQQPLSNDTIFQTAHFLQASIAVRSWKLPKLTDILYLYYTFTTKYTKSKVIHVISSCLYQGSLNVRLKFLIFTIYYKFIIYFQSKLTCA